jgi:hypothetical protein
MGLGDSLGGVFLQIGRAYGAEKSVLLSMIDLLPEHQPMIKLLKSV